MKKSLALIIALAFLLTSVPAFAGTENDAAVVGDIIFARPLGLIGIVAGAGLFVISLPFAAITHSVDKTSKTLIKNPVEYTFSRPVGDFDYSLDAPKEND
ncbi:MAG: hypothetical protein OEW04_11610 [Nitrospirota bacterium]|nr:hypothetical protein [Nitrospirota bacterium]